ncbi:NUDIX hydrolase [candidate division KSB1 bacterium]
MVTKKISLDKAKQDKLFYFVTTIVVYRESDQRCLILKRSNDDEVYPGKWALPGGRLEWGDFDLSKPDTVSNNVLNFNHPLEKHVSVVVEEKAGVVVGNRPKYLDSVFFVRADGAPSVLVRFAVHYVEGDVTPKEGFTDSAWVNEDEISSYDHIDGIDLDILKTIKLFS